MAVKEKLVYSTQELALINKRVIPHHVAIIMDGNRRWAKKHSLTQIKNVIEGHYAGAQVLQDIVAAARQLGIGVLTVWGFSTENWKRPRFEVEGLIQLFERYLRENQKRMVEKKVRLSVIGDLAPFPCSLKTEIKNVIEMTKEGGHCGEGVGIDLVLALNYGGRDDIKRAVERIVTDCYNNNIEKQMISEELISKYLDTAFWKDPDLLIRTSNEMRVSNFLLWQLAYTEIYVTEKLWPDFTSYDLLKAVYHFQERERRQGR